jgi:protein TonB
MRAEASNRGPALAASAALHALLLAAVVFVWPHKPVQVSEVVSVNLVTSDQLEDMRGAIAAPTPQAAATPEPVPQAPAQAAAPVETPQPLPTPTPPQPKPAPTPVKPAPPPKPAPTPKPTPAPTPAKPVPTPAKPAKPTPTAKTAPTDSFDPDAVLASLNKTAKASGAKQSSAKRGAARPETAVQARLANGSGDAAAASAVNNIGVAIQRVWRPNCTIAGAADANITVTFTLGANGKIVGTPTSSADDTGDPVLAAFRDRTRGAIYHAQPFESLPPSLYNQPIELKFSGRAACAE